MEATEVLYNRRLDKEDVVMALWSFPLCVCGAQSF